MMNVRPGTPLLTIALILVGGANHALLAADAGHGQKTPDFSATRSLIRKQLKLGSAPSIAVAVWRDGNAVWEEGCGDADREKKIPATPHTAYAVASVTKSFTATALMLLQERKRLDLDHPVNRYLGSAKVTSPRWNADAAMVRNVAQHTAGLTTFYASCYATDRECSFPIDTLITRYGTLFWQPGSKFDYSNLGYGILGDVVARASGMRYEEFMRREVFSPLGMTHTSIGITRAIRGFAAPRYPKGKGRVDAYIEATPGASSGYSSAHDLMLFGSFLLKTHLPARKPILSDASIDSMLNTTVDGDSGYRYGLGFWIKEDDAGYRTVLAQGGAAGDSASLLLVPSENIVVAVATNGDDVDVRAIVAEILSAMLPPYAARRSTKGEAAPASSPSPQPRPIDGGWSGSIRTYHGSIPLRLMAGDHGEIQAVLESRDPVVLTVTAVHKGHFHARMPGELHLQEAAPGTYDLEFILEEDGDSLHGAVTTVSHPGVDPAAALSLWLSLKKDP